MGLRAKIIRKPGYYGVAISKYQKLYKKNKYVYEWTWRIGCDGTIHGKTSEVMEENKEQRIINTFDSPRRL